MTGPENVPRSRADEARHPSDDGSVPGGRRVAVAAVFGAIAALVAVDLATDYRSGATLPHLVAELGVFAFAATGMAAMLRDWSRARRLAGELRADVLSARGDAERWRREAQEHVAGLSALIDQQFDAWGLSAAERGVALLLLKGLSHKEVAAARGTSERTAREQALSVYRKAGLAGRAELAAFFLEDLLDPGRAAPRSPPPA
jgi:DNA-binding CsgD family transcriptional regulator